jgi:carbon storage regulator CsrA
MLILTRKPDEGILIDDGETSILVSIVGIRGKHVKFGVSADAKFRVERVSSKFVCDFLEGKEADQLRADE